LENLPDGGTVYVDAGTYIIANFMEFYVTDWYYGIRIVNKNLRLTGAGSDKTILKLADGVSEAGYFMFQIAPGAQNMEITGFFFDGNARKIGTLVTFSGTFFIGRTNGTLISNIYIYNYFYDQEFSIWGDGDKSQAVKLWI